MDINKIYEQWASQHHLAPGGELESLEATCKSAMEAVLNSSEMRKQNIDAASMQVYKNISENWEKKYKEDVAYLKGLCDMQQRLNNTLEKLLDNKNFSSTVEDLKTRLNKIIQFNSLKTF